jgi:hypothetical protein
MSTATKSSPPPGAAAILALDALAYAPPQSGEDDDTDYGHYGAPSGNIWRPDPEAGQPPATNPGGRAAPRRRSGGLRATGRTAALVLFPDLPHVASPPRARIRTF